MARVLKKTCGTLSNLKYNLKGIYYKFKKCENFDDSLFAGKKVAIVGGADSALIEKNGSFIDSFDIVVRINKGVELTKIQSEYIGKRTDVLYHSFGMSSNKKFSSDITLELWEKNNLKKIIYCYPALGKFVKQFVRFSKLKTSIPYSDISKESYKEILKILNGNVPTTGFVAIKTIIDSNPNELFLTGFTFFKTGMNPQYRNWTEEDFLFQTTNTHHNHNLEFNYIKNIYLNKNPTSSISVDKGLEKLFKSDKY